MTSRDKIEEVLNGEIPDKIPVDIGGSCLTGMHVSTVYQLRQALKLDKPGTPVEVVNAYMMLGEIGPDLMDAIGSDVVELFGPADMFGFKRENWKEWEFFDGIPVLVPHGFTTEPDEKRDLFLFPGGDDSSFPTGHMPSGGYYFDEIIRQDPIIEGELDPHDNGDDYSAITENELLFYKNQIKALGQSTDRAIMSAFPGTSFGDVGLVPAPWLIAPAGIRNIEEWYISLLTRQEYIREVFQIQMETSLKNLESLSRIIGNEISVNIVTGADFGTQNSLLLPPDTYKELFQPFHREVNNWIHENTSWKTFIHSCGAVFDLIPEIIKAGFDILNPV